MQETPPQYFFTASYTLGKVASLKCVQANPADFVCKITLKLMAGKF